MTVFFSQLINGLSLGSIYALIALGYSMVYGIILLLNFAHGDVIMVGAYMSWFVMNQLGLGPVTAVCATIITCTLLGVVIEKIAYTPLRNAPRISLLITAIGVSFFLEYTAELILGSGAKVIPAYYTNQTFRIGSVPLGLTSVITLLVTVLSMLALTFLRDAAITTTATARFSTCCGLTRRSPKRQSRIKGRSKPRISLPKTRPMAAKDDGGIEAGWVCAFERFTAVSACFMSEAPFR